MLAGRYAYHLGQQTQMNLNPDGARCGIHTSYSMLPKLLKQRGYRSYMLGKWHQGFFRREYIPTERGFDRFIGFYTGGESHRTHVTSYGVYGYLPSEWTPAINETMPSKGCTALWDMHNDTAGSAPSAPTHFGGFAAEANGTYSNELCKCAKTLLSFSAFSRKSERSCCADASGFEQFVDEHLAASPAAAPLPFFAYVAFHNVHLPLEAPPQYLAQYPQGAFDHACASPPCWDREPQESCRALGRNVLLRSAVQDHRACR